MSRSRRKSPYMGLCSGSEKWDKRKNNRKLRKKCKDAIRKGEEILPTMKDVSDPWLMNKDGKIEIDPNKDSEYMRK